MQVITQICLRYGRWYGIPFLAERSIIGSFPNSQHRLIMIKIGLSFQLNSSRPIPGWNFRKTNWEQFKEYIEKNINRIPRCMNALSRFQKLLFKAAKINIPRGFRKKTTYPGGLLNLKNYTMIILHIQLRRKGKNYLPHWMTPGVRDGSKRLKNILTWKEVVTRYDHY